MIEFLGGGTHKTKILTRIQRYDIFIPIILEYTIGFLFLTWSRFNKKRGIKQWRIYR